MKNWLTSLNGALTLSFVALLIELWRGLLDFAFVYPYDAKGLEVITATVYVVLFAVWLLGLNKAQQGKRAGILAALVVGLLYVLGIDLGTIFFYCRAGCAHIEFNYSAWAGLVIGGLGVVALALQVGKRGNPKI